MMHAPIHGLWCATRTWPTRCRGCDARVYFFSCDCGSRVFFDELGPPWPIHDCDTSWARGLRRSFGPSGAVTVELGAGITITRAPDGFAIDDGVLVRARRRRGDAWSDPIRRVEPERGATRTDIGLVRELIAVVNPFTKLDVPDTAIGRALLGPIGGQPVGRITVHIPAVDDGPIESLTAWIPTSVLRDARLTCHVTVCVRMRSVPVGHGTHAWFCDSLEVPG